MSANVYRYISTTLIKIRKSSITSDNCLVLAFYGQLLTQPHNSSPWKLDLSSYCKPVAQRRVVWGRDGKKGKELCIVCS